MYNRQISPAIKKLARQYPVVTLIGPRQSGKTTLIRHLFPKKPYVNLEALDIREMATSDPRGFLEKYPQGAILDEIQRVPELLSYIQPLVDKREKKGMFLLTGSHQLELHQAISQSLAGRTALLSLLPLSLSELSAAKINLDLDDALLMGGYPRIFKDRLNPTIAHRNYFQTYIERDLRQLIQVKNLTQFQRFIRLLAGRVGQLLNVEGISGEVGLSSHTVKEWISILEASFIVFRLEPYFENFGKRIIKSPKIYFTDVGLATYLLGIENKEQLARDPLRGNLVENLVALELIKARYNLGLEPKLFFFRDAHGHEVDLILQSGNHLIPIEVKSSKTFNKEFLKNLTFFKELTDGRSPTSYLIYAGVEEQKIESVHLLNYTHTSSIISKK